MAAHERADDGKGDDEAALRMVFPQIVEELMASDVIDDLYQRNLLTKNEYEEIVDASSKEETKTTNRRILMAVSRRPAGFVPVLANILSRKYSSLSNALEKALVDVTSRPQIDPAPPQHLATETHSVSRGVTTATYVQVLEEQSQKFLQVMNATAIVRKKEVRRLGLIPERVISIKHSSREDANECLLTFLKEDATEEQVLGVFKIASEEKSFERMSEFAADILQQLQREKIEREEAQRREDERKWRSAYEDSLKKHGSVSVEVTRTIFVGPPEVGKSSLKHLLVHNTPKEVKTSTAIMDTPDVVTKRSELDFSSEQYAVEGGTSAWQLVDSNVMKKSLHACITNEEYEENEQYPKELESEDTTDGQRQAFVEEQKNDCPLPKRLKTEHDQSNIPSLDEQHSQLLQEMGGEGKQIKLKNASFIHLLDTGGQTSFQDVLPLLLDVPCTYIQVFNAARSLDEPVPITYRYDDHTRVRLKDAEPGRYMMLRSFSSMLTMAQKCSKELASFRQEDSPLPHLRIFVVGTHKDQLIKEGRLDKAMQDITTFLKALDRKPYYRSIKWDSSARQPFFLINTMADKEERASVNHLRECLSGEGSSLKLDVPVMWFLCQEITRCTPKKFFRLQDLEAFCQKYGFVDGEDADSQFHALLQLLSLLGFYSFFNLKGIPDKDNFVCTDTGVFLKEVSKLLAMQFTAPTCAEMECFKDTGILVFTQQLRESLKMNPEINPKWFLGALQHLGIAVHLPSKGGQERYFIPAVLPQSSGNQKPTSSVAPLCFTCTTEEGAISSPYSYMPQGVFCRLAVELIRQRWKLNEKKSTRSLLKYRWEEFMIFLKESPGFISLIPQVVKSLSPSELHTRCEALFCIVKEALFLSTQAVLGSHFSMSGLAVGFECPCKEVDIPHLAVHSEAEKLTFDCLESHNPLTDTNKHRIWFSSVDGVELKHHPGEGSGIWVLEDCACSEKKLATKHNAKQVLCQFRAQFIKAVDATAIVHDLKHEDIITCGNLAEITKPADQTLQNQILYTCLEEKCTDKALMTVCDKIIAAPGNPNMRALGKDMKGMLEGSS